MATKLNLKPGKYRICRKDSRKGMDFEISSTTQPVIITTQDGTILYDTSPPEKKPDGISGPTADSVDRAKSLSVWMDGEDQSTMDDLLHKGKTFGWSPKQRGLYWYLIKKAEDVKKNEAVTKMSDLGDPVPPPTDAPPIEEIPF